MGLLALALLVVPIVELIVIIKVGGAIGALNTIGLLILISVVGAWLIRREGIGIFRKVMGQLSAGRVPTNDLVDGFLVMFAGALMLTPGFVTDLVAIGLLLPPSRALVRRGLIRRYKGRGRVITATYTGPIDVDESPRREPPSGELGR